MYSWRETGVNAKSVRRKHIVGTKTEYLMRSAAMKGVEGLRLDINVKAIVALFVGKMGNASTAQSA